MEQEKTNFLNQLFSKKDQKKSYLFMILASFAWVTGYIYGNQHNFTPVETNLSRSIVMVLGTYVMCRLMNLNIEFQSPKSWRVLLKRHASFILQGLVLAGMQFLMPLGLVHTIASCGPIFTLIMSRLLKKSQAKSISSEKIKGCSIAFLGILLTCNGKIIYSYIDHSFQFKTGFQNYVESSYLVTIMAVILLLLSMLIWSYGALITQDAECHAFQIVFHFAVCNLLFNSLIYIFLPEKRPATEFYQSLIWIGILLFVSQIFFTLSLNLAQNIGLTNIAAFSVVVVGYGVGVLRYGQTVDIISITGTILVLFGVSMVILAKSKDKSSASDSEKQPKQLSQILKKSEELKSYKRKTIIN